MGEFKWVLVFAGTAAKCSCVDVCNIHERFEIIRARRVSRYNITYVRHSDCLTNFMVTSDLPYWWFVMVPPSPAKTHWADPSTGRMCGVNRIKKPADAR